MSAETETDKFCPLCDVTLDLHPLDDPLPDIGTATACDVAEVRARMVEMLAQVLGTS